MHKGCNIFRIFPLWYTKEYSIGIRHQVEYTDIPCRGRQASIEVIDIAVQLVVGRIEHTGRLYQPHFIHHAPLAEHFRRIYCMDDFAMEGLIGIYDFLHPFFDVFHFSCIYFPIVDIQKTIISFRHRVFEPQNRIGKYIIDCFRKDMAQGTDISPHPSQTGVIDKLNIFRLPATERQIFCPIVHLGTQNRMI